VLPLTPRHFVQNALRRHRAFNDFAQVLGELGRVPLHCGFGGDLSGCFFPVAAA
jgi:hypothetical protein